MLKLQEKSGIVTLKTYIRLEFLYNCLKSQYSYNQLFLQIQDKVEHTFSDFQELRS